MRVTDAPSSRRDGAPGSGGGTTDGRRVLSAVAVAFALVAVLFAVATVLAGRVDARPGPGTGVALFGLLGLAAQGDAGDAIERLVEKVEQFERGEDVAFETDRDDEVGRLYEAVGDFAATVRERERDVAATERYRRKLYEVTSATDLSDERKVDRLLELGTERLGVECGLVTNVDEATGRYEIERVTGTDFVEAGTVTDLSTTFCRKTITSDDVLGLSNAPEEHADDPGYREWGLGCYLGGKIEVEGDLYGTLCFVDPEPREREFTDAEKAFVDLMARWVSHVYERREREGERRVAERALEAAPIGIAIAETGDGDDPLVRVNRAFEEITGYPAEEALGRDCRFLQGENTDDAAVAELAAAVDRDEPVTTTLRNYRKDGTLVDVSVSAAPLYDEDGTVAGVAGVLEDISERKASERELEETKDRLDLAIEGARLGVWDWNVETDEVTFNEQWAEMLGYDLDDLGSNLQTWRDLVHPDDLPRAEAALEAHFAGETEYYECEHRLETKSGDWKWIRDVGKVVERDAEGDPVRAVGVHQDVSERKARERELRERERELSTLIDNVPGMVYRCRNEPDWPFEFVSDGCRDVTGYEPEELVSGAVDWNEEVIAEREDELWTAVQRAVDAGESFQVTYPIRTADGERRWVWEQGQGVFRDDGTLDVLEGVIMDVTDRVERERELERTRDMLEQSQRLASVGAWEFDATGDGASEAVMTDEVYHILNLPTDTTVTVDDAIAFYHPDDRDAIERAIERAVEEGRSFEFEARVVTAAGNERWVRSIGEPVVEDGAVVAVRGSIQDITEPKTFERELRERERDLAEYKEYTDDILDAIDDVFYVLDADGAFQRWNESFVEATGYGDDEIEGMQAREFFPEDQREAVLSGMENALETGGDRTEAEILTADGERVPYEFSATRVENPDGEVGVAGIGRDITRRKERELALQSLHGTTRGLLGAETEADAAELVVDAAEEVLDVAAAVYLLDEETNRLAPVAHTASFDDCCGDASAVATGGDSPLWRSFVDEAAAVVDDPEGVARAEPFGPDVSEGLVVPMGDHGAFVAATANGGIDPDTRQLVETLVATTEAAFDRVESEASLRERDAELAEQNRRLRRQIQVTDIIRQVDRSLIEANSREEIEATVCDRLADAEDVAFAWIGGFGAGGGLEPQAWAGENVSYLDSVSLTAGGDAPEPSVTAATTEEPAVVRNVVDERQRAPWCRSALARDFHSVLSVPLVYEDYSFGVLAVYADEPDVFGDLERSVFAELGTNIANSINAVETRRALHADTFVELALSVDPGETFFGRLARDADCRVEYAGLAAVSDDETRLFVSADAPADRVASALDDAVAVRDYRRVGDGEEDGDGDGTGTSTFEVTVERDLLPARLVRHGVRPRTVAATADGVDVVVDLPRRVDVREFVEMLRETHPSVELVGQRTVEREATTEREFVASLLDSLTDRQLEVLRTAYLAGFFEWPRRSTGEDVAAMLGITQPTVNRHLRFAQQRLLERLFDEPGASPGFVD